MSLDLARVFEVPQPGVPEVNEFLAVLWRWRRLAKIAFAMVFAAVIVLGWLLSDRYEARMEILVEQSQLRRADPVLSGGADAQPMLNARSASSEETLNSEIALLRSEDVLRQVVATTGLASQSGLWDKTMQGVWWLAEGLHISAVLRGVSGFLPALAHPTQEERTAKAIRRMTGKLSIEVIKMSDVIAVSYRASDPQLAAQVLRVLGDVYLKEHALAHYPPGELEFFQQETEQARAKMATAEGKLVAFTQNGGVASGDIQLTDKLRQLSDVQGRQSQTRTSISAIIHRIAALEAQAQRISPRMTTQLKTSDSAILLQQLKSSLLDLEMKRTGLLTKYAPSYPLVGEVDRQIAQAQAALSDAEKSHVTENTTDRDPNYEQVREDLTRSRAELAGLEAQLKSLDGESSLNKSQATSLEQQEVEQQDLMRNAKAAEDNYVLLLHKQEEARISNELDKRSMFNVSIVQSASVPQLPLHSMAWYLLNGVLFGILCSLATVAGANRLDPTLRTLAEVESILCPPMLVAMPQSTAALPRIVDEQGKGLARSTGRIFWGFMGVE